jgi:hypothetical protein
MAATTAFFAHLIHILSPVCSFAVDIRRAPSSNSPHGTCVSVHFDITTVTGPEPVPSGHRGSMMRADAEPAANTHAWAPGSFTGSTDRGRTRQSCHLRRLLYLMTILFQVNPTTGVCRWSHVIPVRANRLRENLFGRRAPVTR